MAKDETAPVDDFDRELPGQTTGTDVERFTQPSLSELRAGILRPSVGKGGEVDNAEALEIAAETLAADNLDRALGEALGAEDIFGQPFRLIGWKWQPSDEGNAGSEYFAVMAIDLGDGIGQYKGEQVVTCGALPVVTFLLWLQERNEDVAGLPALAFYEKTTRSGLSTIRMRRADRRK
jgi:hypothetical protein